VNIRDFHEFLVVMDRQTVMYFYEFFYCNGVTGPKFQVSSLVSSSLQCRSSCYDFCLAKQYPMFFLVKHFLEVVFLSGYSL
jgi:hypothetical protein